MYEPFCEKSKIASEFASIDNKIRTQKIIRPEDNEGIGSCRPAKIDTYLPFESQRVVGCRANPDIVKIKVAYKKIIRIGGRNNHHLAILFVEQFEIYLNQWLAAVHGYEDNGIHFAFDLDGNWVHFKINVSPRFI
jgi:hypothetical protein